jgi:hypothetical protein
VLHEVIFLCYTFNMRARKTCSEIFKENIMAKNTKPKGLPNMGNRPMYEAMVSKFTSNAGGTHDARPKRERTRSTSKRNAIKSGW